MKKYLKILLTLAGLGLLGLLIIHTDIAMLLGQLKKFSWHFLTITLLAFIWFLLQAISWQKIQAALVTYTPLWLFFRAKLASEALNMLLPTANLGGDTARAMMVKRTIPLDKGIPGVMADKTVEFTAGVFFIASGLAYGLFYVDLPQFLVVPGIICLTISALALGLAIFLQIKGLFDKFSRFCKRLPFPFLHRLIEKHLETVKKLDAHLGYLYRNAKGKLALAFILQYGTRMLKAVEVFIILSVMHIPVDFGDAFFLTAMTVVVNTIFFILPGQWGVSEAAQVLLLQNMGVASPAGIDLATAGLGLAVIRRIRRLLFTLLGIIFFYWIPGAPTTDKPIETT